MTYIEAKALAMVNAVRAERGGNSYTECTHIRRDYDDGYEALCRAIEQHEAYKQEVSDAVGEYFQPPNYLGKFNDTLGCFIIPKPKPDPLVEALKELAWDEGTVDEYAGHIRAALEARGLEIREKGETK
jgi:hypothetical protein